MNAEYFKNLDDNTRNICIGSFVSMFLIILFIISPLSSFLMTAFLVKIIVLLIILYIIYLNFIQAKNLQKYTDEISQEIKAQISINIVCGYVFIAFLILLFIFVIRSFF